MVSQYNKSRLVTKPKCSCAPSEDSDQPGHPPSLIRVFAVRMKKAWVLSYPLSAQRRLRSDWANAQADLSLRRAHTHFVGFVTRRLTMFVCLFWFNVAFKKKSVISRQCLVATGSSMLPFIVLLSKVSIL